MVVKSVMALTMGVLVLENEGPCEGHLRSLFACPLDRYSERYGMCMGHYKEYLQAEAVLLIVKGAGRGRTMSITNSIHWVTGP
jgi:hypothetical protein